MRRALFLLATLGVGCSTIRPAELTRRPPADVPGQVGWWQVARCSVGGLAQAWAGEGAVNCGEPPGEPWIERGGACLVEAQARRIAAYLVLGSSAYVVDASGNARVLETSAGKYWPVELQRDSTVEGLLFSGTQCARFSKGAQWKSPECEDAKPLPGFEWLRPWACTGVAGPSALPPERLAEAAADGDPIPLGIERRFGGAVLDGRVPAVLLESGTWSITTLGLPAGDAEPPVHVHSRGDVLLVVDDGSLEVSVDGRPTTALHAGQWVYLPAGVAHRVAVLDPSTVTVHLRGGEPCPELVPGRSPSRTEVAEVPSWARGAPEAAGATCSRSLIAQTWAGPGALDCGTLGLKDHDSGYRCAMWAQEHGRAFFLTETQQGIDSAVSRGLVRTEQGDSYELQMDGMDYVSGFITWRACRRFVGPSWRAHVSLDLGNRSPECDLDSPDERFHGRLGSWSCREPGRPPGIPEPARRAAQLVKTEAIPEHPRRTEGLAGLGPGPLVQEVFRPRAAPLCMSEQKTSAQEIWFLSGRDELFFPGWSSAPAGAERSRTLRAWRFLPGFAAVVYRKPESRGGAPAFEPCKADRIERFRPSPPLEGVWYSRPTPQELAALAVNVDQVRATWVSDPTTLGDRTRRWVANALLTLGRCAEARAELKRVAGSDRRYSSIPMLLAFGDPGVCAGQDEE